MGNARKGACGCIYSVLNGRLGREMILMNFSPINRTMTRPHICPGLHAVLTIMPSSKSCLFTADFEGSGEGKLDEWEQYSREIHGGAPGLCRITSSIATLSEGSLGAVPVLANTSLTCPLQAGSLRPARPI